MSMLSDRLVPCACETDVTGVVSMYALTLATGNALALLDSNNNYGDDRGKCVCTHCSNFPRSFVYGKDSPEKLGGTLTCSAPRSDTTTASAQ